MNHTIIKSVILGIYFGVACYANANSENNSIRFHLQANEPFAVLELKVRYWDWDRFDSFFPVRKNLNRYIDYSTPSLKKKLNIMVSIIKYWD